MVYLFDLKILHFQEFPDEMDLICKGAPQECASANLYQ